MPKRFFLMVIAFAVSVLPAVVSAAGGFTDVADTNVFKADIDWLAASGVTKGCNPPMNDKFCPGSTVTREQMAAFMHRLAASKVVDAATAVSADTATNATNAAKLEGKTAAKLSSIGASGIAHLTFPGGDATKIASLTGFDVPANGGVITAAATGSGAKNSGVNVGVLWIEIDGTGACDIATIPVGFGWWDTSVGGLDSTSLGASMASEVAAGTHRIDLCTAAIGTTASTDLKVRMNVVWSPVASGAGVASASDGQTLDELFAPSAGVFDN